MCQTSVTPFMLKDTHTDITGVFSTPVQLLASIESHGSNPVHLGMLTELEFKASIGMVKKSDFSDF